MSHRQDAACPACGWFASTGWTEPGLPQVVFCGGCDARLAVDAVDPSSPREPAPHLHQRARGPVERRSRRGRVVVSAMGTVFVDHGPVPVRLEIDGERIGWAVDLAAVPCPSCAGRLLTFEEVLRQCPRCGAGPLEDLDPERLTGPGSS